MNLFKDNLKHIDALANVKYIAEDVNMFCRAKVLKYKVNSVILRPLLPGNGNGLFGVHEFRMIKPQHKKLNYF